MNNSMTILKIEDLAKTYFNGPEKLLVLKKVNLEVEPKSILIITGESGCGKSTLLNLIAGLDTPSEGTIICKEYNVGSLKEKDLTKYRSKSVGLVFQFHYLLKDFTALENVMLPAYMTGISRTRSLEAASELLERVNLYHRKDHFPFQLSGGERQKVAVARSLVNNPEIILADEPTGNLDEDNSKIVEELLFSLVHKSGKTLILVTHDLTLVKKGDRHLSLERGELVEK